MTLLLVISLTSCHSAREIVQWKDQDMVDILAGYNSEIYDSPSPFTRRVLNQHQLEDLPQEDEDGKEIGIYTDNGYKLQRRLGRFSRHTKPHGILVDLRKIDSLLRSEDTDDLMDEDEDHLTSNKYYVYPQAGLVTAGHFQSYSLIPPFTTLLEQFNDELQQESDSLNTGPQSPIAGISCQGYNTVMHSTRGRTAQHHDAQKGLITASLAGAWATQYSTQQTARRMKAKCDAHFPHQEFREKISRDAISRDLRLENVYTIEIDNLPLRLQNGG